MNLMNQFTLIGNTVKPVLSRHPLGMAYWPFNTGLTNVRVIQGNEGIVKERNIYPTTN